MTEIREGLRYDAGKDPWSLVPFDALRGIIRVLDYGSQKYAPRNWELGMDWSRCFDSLQRHMTAWWMGEDKDPETGFSHLWLAGCNILFLISYEMRGIGRDNRPSTVRRDLTWTVEKTSNDSEVAAE